MSRIDIVDVVDQYVPLKKNGQNYLACCPFHKEKSPSFTVSPVKQFYHCFGCGVHGSAIGFVMQYQGLSFVDAVQLLADGVGIPLPDSRATANQKFSSAERKRKTSLEQILQTASVYYKKQLKSVPGAIEYLKSNKCTMVGQRRGHGNGVHQKVKNRTLRLMYRTIYRTTNNFSILYRYIVGDFLLIFRTDIRATVCEIYKNECYQSTMYGPSRSNTHTHTKNGKTKQPTAPHPSSHDNSSSAILSIQRCNAVSSLSPMASPIPVKQSNG